MNRDVAFLKALYLKRDSTASASSTKKTGATPAASSVSKTAKPSDEKQQTGSLWTRLFGASKNPPPKNKDQTYNMFDWRVYLVLVLVF